ncbi:RNA polymerase sigma factor [Streptomyces sp. NPDC020799]|uniref:RNA polymerase sigma factor n=1 Tax=Streptomyces sp. NPDC020799 TaxID=3365091 RepID=UPI0037B0018E
MLDVTAGHSTASSADPDRLSEVFALHSGRVQRFILNRLDRPDWHLAEDLTSETFLRLVRSYSGRPVDGRVVGLLKTLARHTVTDHYRRHSAGERATDFGDWFEARRLPATPAAEECAVERMTALAALTASPALGVAA